MIKNPWQSGILPVIIAIAAVLDFVLMREEGAGVVGEATGGDGGGWG
jgi:hypothetical protein